VELAADDDTGMQWNSIELETGEVYVGQNSCGEVLDKFGHDMEWSSM
jgi:hypothetical protein